MNVVIVDDDFLPIEQTIRELKQAGFTVKHLQDADTALTHVREFVGVIDFVIVDVMVGTAIEDSAFTAEETTDYLTTGVALVSRWMDDAEIWHRLKGRVALWSVRRFEDIQAQIDPLCDGDDTAIHYWYKPEIENGSVLQWVQHLIACAR